MILEAHRSRSLCSGLPVLALALLVGCAGGAAGTSPVATQPPTPTLLKVLGATYTVPEYVELKEGEQSPGFAKFAYGNSLTACKGYLFFNTVGSKDQHDEYVRANFTDGIEGNFKKNQMAFKRNDAEVTVLGTAAHLVSWIYTENSTEVESGLFEVFVPAQNLSFAGLHDCPIGLLQKESQIVTGMLETQKPF